MIRDLRLVKLDLVRWDILAAGRTRLVNGSPISFGLLNFDLIAELPAFERMEGDENEGAPGIGIREEKPFVGIRDD
jgi:hypothetical protein